MLEEWVDLIQAPHNQKVSRSLLIFDQFKAHTSPSVLEKFKKLNTDILVVPAGLTYYTQPLDVFVKGPVKARIKQYQQEYMINTEESSKIGPRNLNDINSIRPNF